MATQKTKPEKIGKRFSTFEPWSKRPVAPGYFTLEQYLTIAGLSRPRMYQLWAEGLGPEREKIAGKVVIPQAAGIAWLKKRYPAERIDRRVNAAAEQAARRYMNERRFEALEALAEGLAA
jgi:predicted DNA-binding transcriptional regulator AlpA